LKNPAKFEKTKFREEQERGSGPRSGKVVAIVLGGGNSLKKGKRKWVTTTKDPSREKKGGRHQGVGHVVSQGRREKKWTPGRYESA